MILGRYQFLFPAIMLGFFVALAGCGKPKQPTATVRGIVKMDGQTLKQGTIFFLSVDPKISESASASITNGTYEIKTFPGSKRIQISATNKVKQKAYKGPDAPEIEVDGEELVSSKYNNDTKLKFDVKEGESSQNFDIESVKKVGN